MEITDNRKIAEWLGWKWITPAVKQNFDPYFEDATGDSRRFPFFTECDADAIMLLPALVAKGYHFELNNGAWQGVYSFEIWMGDPRVDYLAVERHATISGTISAAVLTLIKRKGSPC